MSIFSRFLPFAATRDGRFLVNLPESTRQVLAALAEQLDEVVVSDAPETRRLFPTAYPDDPERDAGYQVFARDQLIEQRQNAVGTVLTTAERETLSEEELSAWLAVTNDLRLVLGTRLDVSEDDGEIDPEHPEAELQVLYHQLGILAEAMVSALHGAL